MFDENSKYPNLEFEMAAVSGNFRCFVFDPDKNIPDFLERMSLTDEILAWEKKNQKTLSPENLQKAKNDWFSKAHECFDQSVVCQEPFCRHGRIWLANRSLFIILCPGDLIFLDSENEPWAVSDPDGGRLRLISNGHLITKDLSPKEKEIRDKTKILC